MRKKMIIMYDIWLTCPHYWLRNALRLIWVMIPNSHHPLFGTEMIRDDLNDASVDRKTTVTVAVQFNVERKEEQKEQKKSSVRTELDVWSSKKSTRKLIWVCEKRRKERDHEATCLTHSFQIVSLMTWSSRGWMIITVWTICSIKAGEIGCVRRHDFQ